MRRLVIPVLLVAALAIPAAAQRGMRGGVPMGRPMGFGRGAPIRPMGPMRPVAPMGPMVRSGGPRVVTVPNRVIRPGFGSSFFGTGFGSPFFGIDFGNPNPFVFSNGCDPFVFRCNPPFLSSQLAFFGNGFRLGHRHFFGTGFGGFGGFGGGFGFSPFVGGVPVAVDPAYYEAQMAEQQQLQQPQQPAAIQPIIVYTQPPPSEGANVNEPQSARGPQEQAATKMPEPEELAPTILVYRDNRREEVKNYAIVGDTLYAFLPHERKKIPLSDLDLPATIKVNDERGVDFRVPRQKGS